MNLSKLYIQKFIASVKGDKKRKKELKNLIMQQKHKLGVTYNVFDGIELLEASIKSVRNNVDYINVVYQNISNFGEKDDSCLSLLKSLKDKGLIDNIIYYETDFALTPQQNETAKRNIGLKDCIKNNCTYFLNMDTDEFYTDEQFKKAKEFIYYNNISSCACAMYYYIKHPHYKFMEPRRTMYVPFICKINKYSKIVTGVKTFCLVDPTRMIVTKNGRNWLFAPQALTMHHMAYVRKDLEKKFRNSTANQAKQQQEKLESIKNNVINYQYPNDFFFYDEGSYKIEKVNDIFNVGDSL